MTMQKLSDLMQAKQGSNLNEFDTLVNLEDIEIREQIRIEFENEEHDLAELGQSLRVRQLHAIVLRVNDAGNEKPYVLVAGERRVRAARLEGLTELRARVMELTDEEAEDAQFAENVHHKNFELFEEAKKVQRDIDAGKSIDEVLAIYKKSRAWLSKMLALLNLPEQTKRLVAENVSADVEVINAVKQIEKVSPAKAKELVDDLKATRGKSDARDKAAAVKEQVKPSKKAKPEYKQTDIEDENDKPYTPPATPAFLEQQRKKAELEASSGVVATPRDRGFETPSEVSIFAEAKSEHVPTLGKIAIGLILDKAFNEAASGIDAKSIIDTLGNHCEDVKEYLQNHYNAGKATRNLGRSVILALRSGQFSTTGGKALALSAFLHGADGQAKFSLVDIIGSVKA